MATSISTLTHSDSVIARSTNAPNGAVPEASGIVCATAVNSVSASAAIGAETRQRERRTEGRPGH